MQMLEIMIEENASGATRPVEVVAEAPVGALVPALVEELKLPQTDLFGNPLVYTLRYSSGGPVLPENKSLAAAGIAPGTRLALESYAVNGSVAAMMDNQGVHQRNSFHSDMTLADNVAFPIPARNTSGALPTVKKEHRRSRRAFLMLGGVILGAGSLGLGYAAYRSFFAGNLTFTQPQMMTHVQPTQAMKMQQPPKMGVPTMARQQLLFTQHKQTVRAVTWSPDGTLLASGSNDAHLLIWNTAGNVQQALQEDGTVRAIAWSPDNQQLAVGAANQVIFLNPRTGTVLARSTHRHTNVVTSVAWSPQGQPRLVTSGADRRAIVWDGMAHLPLTTFALHTSPIESASWAADGQTIATASTGGVVRVWNATDAQEVHGYYLDVQTPMLVLAFAPTGSQLAVGGNDGLVRIWNGLMCQQQGQSGFGLQCMDMPVRLRAHTQAVRTLAWSPDGRFLATGGDDGLMAIWYPARGQGPLFTVRHNAAVRALRWSPNGQQVATASGNAVIIWALK